MISPFIADKSGHHSDTTKVKTPWLSISTRIIQPKYYPHKIQFDISGSLQVKLLKLPVPVLENLGLENCPISMFTMLFQLWHFIRCSVVAMGNVPEAGDHFAAEDQVLFSQVVAPTWKTLF